MRFPNSSRAFSLVCTTVILLFSIAAVLGGEGRQTNLSGDTAGDLAKRKTDPAPGSRAGEENFLRLAETLPGIWRGEVIEPNGVYRSYPMMLKFRSLTDPSDKRRVLQGRVAYARYECGGTMKQLDPVSDSGVEYLVFEETITFGRVSKFNQEGCDDGIVYISIVDRNTLKWQWGWNPEGQPTAWATLVRVN